ncbi:hypothetical protein HDU85_002387, partial [Gaertneriomyces sp. JEL0708]
MRAGGGTGLYININAQARADFGGGNTATMQNYSGALRFLSQRGKGIVVDEHGAVDVSERFSVGTTSDVVAFPPAEMTTDTTVLTGQAYGNGTYVSSASSVYNNLPASNGAWKAFATGTPGTQGWYPATDTYSATAPYSYVGSVTTLVDGVPVSGEWIQLSMPVSISLSSFEFACNNSVRFIKEYDLVGSNDNGATFTKILSSTYTGTVLNQIINVPVNPPRVWRTLRLIVKNISGNGTFPNVIKLVFNGTPVAMDVKGAVSAKQVVTENLVCSGEMNINGLDTIEETVGTVTYPDIEMTAATTGSYTATASTTLSATWTPWKLYNRYA